MRIENAQRLAAVHSFSPGTLRARRRQSGVALIVVLLFLVALTAIAVWGTRQSLLSEGLARNQMDQEVARQAAEAALRDAERDIMNVSATQLAGASCNRGLGRKLILADFTADCRTGLCAKADASYAASDWSAASAKNNTVAEPWWPASKGGLWNNSFDDKPKRAPVDSANCSTFTGGVPLGTFTGIASLPGVAVQPEYLIEVFRRKDVRINGPEAIVTSTGLNANQWSTMYRVTARGFGYSPRTQVVLQSIFFP